MKQGSSFRALHAERRVQDQQALPADRSLQADRPDGDQPAEPGRAGRPVRIPAEQAEHRRAQRAVPHAAPHHPHDGADDRPQARRTHRRPGGRNVRLPGERLPVHPGNAHLARNPGIRRGGLAAPPDRRPAERSRTQVPQIARSSCAASTTTAGMTMLRIGSMNLMLHGIEVAAVLLQGHALESFNDEREYDVILMNPPFKGAIDKNDVIAHACRGHHQDRAALRAPDPARPGYGRALRGDRAGWGAVRLQPGTRRRCAGRSSKTTAWTG